MSVSTRVKRMTVAAVAVLAVLGAAMVALPRLVSEDEARAAATRALLDLTGIEPEIGSARLVLLPRPAVRIESVRIDDGVRPAFSARALQATLQFFPLLQGRAAIAALAFERPRLTVQTDDKGVFMIGLPFRADPAGADVAARPEIRIVDGRLMIHAADGELIESISAIDCALAWTGAGLTASGSFHWRAVPTDISLSIVDTAALVRGDRSGLRLRLDSEPMRIGFDGGIVYLNGLQADGVVSAEARSLRNALALLPAGPLTRGGFGPFQIKAQATLTPTSVNLSGLTVELDGNRAEGGLTLKHEAGRILVQATLASEASDFTPYSGGLALTGDDGRDWSREPIQLDMLDAFDLDLRLSSRRVTVRKTEFARVAAAATMRNGQFALSVGEARFYDGTLQGRAAIGFRDGDQAEIKLEATFTDFDLNRGLAMPAGTPGLEGKGTLTLALEGSGKHIHDITRSLSGSVALTAANGNLNGINVAQVLRRIERQPLSGLPDIVGGRTPFDRLTATLRIADGTGKLEATQVESSRVRIDLDGETSVARRNFDLKGTATLLRTEAPADASPPFEIPFLVRGSWDRPFLLPDPTALIQRSGAAAPLLDAARRQAEREKAAAEKARAQNAAAAQAADGAASPAAGFLGDAKR